MYDDYCGFYSFRGERTPLKWTTLGEGGQFYVFGSFLRSMYRMGIVFMGGGKGW